ncbi:hypothetical protein OC845_001623 [Tilletia horrida]|nr:hypothetical protein OC845_001623 [Tilletia horrida]
MGPNKQELSHFTDLQLHHILQQMHGLKATSSGHPHGYMRPELHATSQQQRPEQVHVDVNGANIPNLSEDIQTLRRVKDDLNASVRLRQNDFDRIRKASAIFQQPIIPTGVSDYEGWLSMYTRPLKSLTHLPPPLRSKHQTARPINKLIEQLENLTRNVYIEVSNIPDSALNTNGAPGSSDDFDSKDQRVGWLGEHGHDVRLLQPLPPSTRRNLPKTHKRVLRAPPRTEGREHFGRRRIEGEESEQATWPNLFWTAPARPEQPPGIRRRVTFAEERRLQPDPGYLPESVANGERPAPPQTPQDFGPSTSQVPEGQNADNKNGNQLAEESAGTTSYDTNNSTLADPMEVDNSRALVITEIPLLPDGDVLVAEPNPLYNYGPFVDILREHMSKHAGLAMGFGLIGQRLKERKYNVSQRGHKTLKEMIKQAWEVVGFGWHNPGDANTSYLWLWDPQRPFRKSSCTQAQWNDFRQARAGERPPGLDEGFGVLMRGGSGKVSAKDAQKALPGGSWYKKGSRYHEAGAFDRSSSIPHLDTSSSATSTGFDRRLPRPGAASAPPQAGPSTLSDRGLNDNGGRSEEGRWPVAIKAETNHTNGHRSGLEIETGSNGRDAVMDAYDEAKPKPLPGPCIPPREEAAGTGGRFSKLKIVRAGSSDFRSVEAGPSASGAHHDMAPIMQTVEEETNDDIMHDLDRTSLVLRAVKAEPQAAVLPERSTESRPAIEMQLIRSDVKREPDTDNDRVLQRRDPGASSSSPILASSRSNGEKGRKRVLEEDSSDDPAPSNRRRPNGNDGYRVKAEEGARPRERDDGLRPQEREQRAESWLRNRDREREREREREEDQDRSWDRSRSRSWHDDRDRDWDRDQRDRDWDRERRRDYDVRDRERERDREYQRTRDWDAREKERDRERDREWERLRERDYDRERDRDRDRHVYARDDSRRDMSGSSRRAT